MISNEVIPATDEGQNRSEALAKVYWLLLNLEASSNVFQPSEGHKELNIKSPNSYPKSTGLSEGENVS